MTRRLEQSLTKLYHAYHNDLLEPECSCGCAVGNILNRTDAWKHLSDDHGSLHLNYVGKVHEALGRTFSGYKPSELLLIEKTFLEACGYQTPLRSNYKRPKNPTDKDLQFNGLCEVVSLLCAMDSVPDAMKLHSLFDRVDNTPKHALREVLYS